MQNKNNEMLVQLTTTDLFQLITRAVKQEMDKITDVIKLNPKESEIKSDLLSKKQVMELFNVSDTTLYLWNKKDILKNKKVSSRVYYLKNDVMNKLNSVA